MEWMVIAMVLIRLGESIKVVVSSGKKLSLLGVVFEFFRFG
jgi:hypothetical protein